MDTVPGIEFVCPGFASGACVRNIYCGGRIDIECPGLAWMKKPDAKKRKKPANNSPTQRSLKEMRKRGYLCAIVEKWNPHAKIRQDMFGFVDIVAIKGEDIIGVQACVGSSVSSRVTKIVEHANYAAVAAAMRISVHGWRKAASGKWMLREVEL